MATTFQDRIAEVDQRKVDMAIRRIKAADFLSTLPKRPTQQRLANSRFAPYAQAVGWVCMRQSYLEMVMMNLLCELIPVTEQSVAQSLAADLEMRHKLQTLRGVAAVRRPTEDWFTRLVKIINLIENYASERNRFAHDVWVIDEKTGDARKLRFKVQITKPDKQNRNQRQLSTLDDNVMELEAMYALADNMDKASKDLDDVRRQFHALSAAASIARNTDATMSRGDDKG